ncbi:MAG: cytidine deaminase [Cytophagia bacterium]|nr:cytidine deaminase [Cytophagia bacterium]NBW35422.1 cytidine deaminase [Cytophagia bacterium]
MSDFKFFKSQKELDPETQHLVDRAIEWLDHAYAPYSNFHVSSAVLLEDGTIVMGTNQENAAYPSGLCAERLAVFSANAQYPDKKIKKVVIVARKKDQKELTPAASCGGCRQVMLESENRQGTPFEVIMLSHEKEWIVASAAAALLPFAFSKKNL